MFPKFNNMIIMNIESAALTLEQKFKLEVLKEQVKHLSKEQAQDYLMELFRQQMVKDNLMKQMLKSI